MRKLIIEVAGGLDAPASAVAEVVRADLATVAGGAYRPTVAVEGERTTYAIQGRWWYRGEYAIEPDGAGRTTFTHRVYDVARWARWAVPLATRGSWGSARRRGAGSRRS